MKILNVVGARPQFVKLGPILKAIEEHNQSGVHCRIQEILVHTGQHYDKELSKIFFDELSLKEPDYNLGVGSGAQGFQTGEMLKRTEGVLLNEKPDWVVVYGDTNSTLAGALAAGKLQIRVAHVEAGLRSFNRTMPEEVNRVLTDHISNLLFCPTQAAITNLANEGIVHGVHHVGDVMYDSVLHYANLAEKHALILKKLALDPRRYALATVHRAENTDDSTRLENILGALDEISARGLNVVFPLHPRTRRKMKEFGLLLNHAKAIEPVSYLEMLLLEKNAKIILTDSGGVQKEAFFFQVPCVTLRDETEWLETVESGWNQLAGTDPKRIGRATQNAQSGDDQTDCYGDGRAASKIVDVLIRSNWK
ncbi:UDP-N-acetylglucosamine 2-epimerase (non-hydrolyzing) [Candidatus Acetothermia bacterium]|nr:UDP-N-acetylglucosamine 2-epimerase (non-hydrolyzing) [Candidatus Acetothermia bacterium]MBI3643991.1 UDP-N-acetylglucosamine 2-epimerase (non-hydrolyzing) [Candidatus Acetothermia bacterium]